MTILAATDFSENSKAALRLGAQLAKSQNRSMVLVHVVDLAASDNAWRVLVESPDDIERSALIEAREQLESFLEEALPDESSRPRLVRFEAVLGNPIDQILAHAETLSNPLILAGTRGGSRLQEFFLGSTARRLVRQAGCPVILAPPGKISTELKKFVVAMDFSGASEEALKRGAKMARANDGLLYLVHGFIIPEVTALQASMASVVTEMELIIREKRESIRNMVEDAGVDDVVAKIEVIQAPPATAVIVMAEDMNADMIFIGSHGRRGWSRFFLGNTAERVMRRAPCPLYIIPAPRGAE